jgi:hypothetical protein
VLQGEEVIELHLAHLGAGALEVVLPILRHAGEEGQFAGDGGP